MAPTERLDKMKLLDKMQRYRLEKDKLDTLDKKAVAEKLEQIYNFLVNHESDAPADATHEVLNSYDDWWVGRNSIKKLTLAKDTTVDQLWNYMGDLFDMGIPMTIGEKRTNEFKFLQDLELYGTKDTCIQAEQLIQETSKFFLLLGQSMLELYPSFQQLDVFILNGSGENADRGIQQTAIRFVWPLIIVDKDRAQRVMDFVVHKLISSEDQDLKALESQMRNIHDENQWKNAFVDKIYCGQQPIRMPLNDSVASPPLPRPEKRPFKLFSVFRFSRGSEAPELIYNGANPGNDDLSGFDILKICCIRQPQGTPVTEWTAPTWKGEQKPRAYFTGIMQNGAGPSRSGGHVRQARTFGGSGEPRMGGQNRGGPQYGDRSKQETQKTYTRKFEGSLEDFKDKLAGCLGDAGKCEDFDEQRGSLTWNQTGSGDNGAKIVFRPDARRVYFIGKENQLRSLLEAMALYVQPVDDTDTVAASVTARASTRGGGYAGSQAPSQAFAPRSVSGGSAVSKAKPQVKGPTSLAAGSTRTLRTSAEGRNENGARQVPYERIVTSDFTAETSDEMDLNLGDHVTVTKDDDDDPSNIDRWVYGQNRTTGKQGYFPLSFTKQAKVEG